MVEVLVVLMIGMLWALLMRKRDEVRELKWEIKSLRATLNDRWDDLSGDPDDEED